MSGREASRRWWVRAAGWVSVVLALWLSPAVARAVPADCPPSRHIGVVGGGVYGEDGGGAGGFALALDYGYRVNFGCRRWVPDGAHGWTFTPTARHVMAFGDGISQVGIVDVGFGIDLIWVEASLHGGAALAASGVAGVFGVRWGMLAGVFVLRLDRHFSAGRQAVLVTGGLDVFALMRSSASDDSGGGRDVGSVRPREARRSVEDRIGPRRER